jgi:hypothetical protein
MLGCSITSMVKVNDACINLPLLGYLVHKVNLVIGSIERCPHQLSLEFSLCE